MAVAEYMAPLDLYGSQCSDARRNPTHSGVAPSHLSVRQVIGAMEHENVSQCPSQPHLSECPDVPVVGAKPDTPEFHTSVPIGLKGVRTLANAPGGAFPVT